MVGEARGASAKVIFFMRIPRLCEGDTVRSAFNRRHGDDYTTTVFRSLCMVRLEIPVKSRKKLKQGVETRANESTRICLGARNGVFQICVPQREDSTAHRLQSFWIARRSFLGSLLPDR
jgi:hypothetical protein